MKGAGRWLGCAVALVGRVWPATGTASLDPRLPFEALSSCLIRVERR
jgi:hypothetical protein